MASSSLLTAANKGGVCALTLMTKCSALPLSPFPSLLFPSLLLSSLVFSCLLLSYLVFSGLVSSRLVLPCRVLSRLLLSCLVLTCLLLFFLSGLALGLSCLVFSCLALPCLSFLLLLLPFTTRENSNLPGREAKLNIESAKNLSKNITKIVDFGTHFESILGPWADLGPPWDLKG